MPGEEVLLLVFDVGGVVQGVVHIPVTVGVGDALDGPCSRFPQGNSGIGPLDNQDEEVLFGPVPGPPVPFPACRYGAPDAR